MGVTTKLVAAFECDRCSTTVESEFEYGTEQTPRGWKYLYLTDSKFAWDSWTSELLLCSICVMDYTKTNVMKTAQPTNKENCHDR